MCLYYSHYKEIKEGQQLSRRNFNYIIEGKILMYQGVLHTDVCVIIS